MSVKHLLIGSGDFSLIIGATEAPELETAYDTATNVFPLAQKVGIKNKAEKKEHHTAEKGVLRRDDVRFLKHSLGYKLTVQEFTPQMVRALFFASQGTTSGTPEMENFTPLGSSQGLRGFARLRIWGNENQTNPRLIHKDFSCVVTLANDPEVAPEDYSSLELDVDITEAVGIVSTLKF